MGVRNEINEKGFVSYLDENVENNILVIEGISKGQRVNTTLVTNNINFSGSSNSIILVNAKSTRIVITLPSINNLDGFILYIKKIDKTVNEVEIKGSVGEKIDDDANKILNTPYTSIKIVSNNNNWWII